MRYFLICHHTENVSKVSFEQVERIDICHILLKLESQLLPYET